jgi:hypothetical protein
MKNRAGDGASGGAGDPVACWNANAEKLRCLIVLDDDVAAKLSDRAGDAFCRAFIVEDRVTGAVKLKFRFRYSNPDERNWFSATTDKRGPEAVEHFESGMRFVLDEAARRLGFGLPKDSVKSFYPPDDGGDVGSVLIWLEMHDLIEMTVGPEDL